MLRSAIRKEIGPHMQEYNTIQHRCDGNCTNNTIAMGCTMIISCMCHENDVMVGQLCR